MREHEYEPVPGLPEQLPEGEHLVWQGRPSWSALANRVFHVRALAIYFALLIVVHMVYLTMNAASLDETIMALVWQSGLSAVAIGVLSVVARLYANNTLYTFTNRRLVLKSGIAVPMMINLPWAKVERAGLRMCSDGTGDIVLGVEKTHKLYRMMIWPHVRPWHFQQVEPLMRGIADPQYVAEQLGLILSNKPKSTPDAQSGDDRAAVFQQPLSSVAG